MLTKRGWVAVELLVVGDELASRAESDPGAEIEWQAVEECFRRTGRVLHLHFTDGELIRTTPEHPFWVRGEGWVPAGALKAGDKLSTLSGEWVALREAFDTEQWEPVYNVRVANTHTYFVGDETWGFALWAHNVSCQEVVAEVQAVTGIQEPFKIHAGLSAKIAKAMTTYATNTSREWRARNEAFADLDKIAGVGPAKAAKIFWNILLQIGTRYQQTEQGVTLSTARLDLMKKALHSPSRPEQCVSIVLRPNSDYYLPNSGVHYFTDHRGRIQRAEFNLNSSNLNTGPDGNTTWVGHLGASGDVGGHLAGRQFSGQNQYPNLVPMDKTLNSYPYEGYSGGGYGRMEAIWAQALTRNRNVSNVSVTLNYGTNDVRPDSFRIKFTIRGQDFTLTFMNNGTPLDPQQIQLLDAALAAATADEPNP